MRIKPLFLRTLKSPWPGLVMLLVVTGVLWWNLADHASARRASTLQTWANLELQLVQQAAQLSRNWMETRIQEDGISLEQAESEVTERFVQPLLLFQDGTPFFYGDLKLIADMSDPNPIANRGKTSREIFITLEAQGAKDYVILVRGIELGTEGVTSIIRDSAIGREWVAWSSFRVEGQSYTIGIAVLEMEILDVSGVDEEYQRNLIGVVMITILLSLTLVYGWMWRFSEQKRMESLQVAVKEQTDQLQNSEERYRQLVEQISAVTYIDMVDDHSSSIYMSPQAEQVLGYSADKWLSDPSLWFKIIHPDDIPRVQAENRRTNLTGEPFELDYRIIDPQGKIRWVHDSATLTRMPGNSLPCWHGVIYDISGRKEMEEKLRYLNSHDALTGIYNRAFFEEEMQRLQHSRQFPISILVGDVDGLKRINDRFGHAAGDEALKRAARLLSESFRGEDILARIGGDEFAVLLPGTSALQGHSAMERARARILAEIANSNQIPLRISLGVATGNHGELLENVLKEADDNMYRDKMANRTADDRR